MVTIIYFKFRKFAVVVNIIATASRDVANVVYPRFATDTYFKISVEGWTASPVYGLSDDMRAGLVIGEIVTLL